MKAVSPTSETQHGPRQNRDMGDGCTGQTQSSGSALPPFTPLAGAETAVIAVLQLGPVPEHTSLQKTSASLTISDFWFPS